LYALSFLSVTPDQIGISTLIAGIATVVVGGIASWRGCVIGAIVVIGVPDFFQSLQIWEPVIYGGVLLLAAVFMPEGLFGLWRLIVTRLGFRGKGEEDRGRPSGEGAIALPTAVAATTTGPLGDFGDRGGVSQ
jgi:branched-chain amino acid transport system permease protein